MRFRVRRNTNSQSRKMGRPPLSASSLFDLSGKVAVVTGSSRGIGRAIVEQMAAAGAHVVVSSRKAPACQEVVDAINEKEGREAAIAIPANISDKDALQRLVDETRAKWGKIDILVCNAASNPHFGSMLEIDDEAFDKVLSNNIKSNHWLSQMVLPEMAERGEGAIVIISSITGVQGSSVIGTYGISKAADMQLARNIASEFGPKGVRANAIAPGLIKTDFARALWENPDILKQVTSKAPLKRIGMPDEIAGAAVFLASPAGAFMTGQTLVIDGGVDIAESGF